MSEPAHSIAARSAFARWAYFVTGWVLVGIGIVGLILPVMPGTVFLILAAGCFTRSSPRFEAWLLAHPRLGPGVVAWREKGAIPLRAKGIAVGAMTASLAVMALSGVPGWAILLSAAVFAGVGGWMWTRPDG